MKRFIVSGALAAMIAGSVPAVAGPSFGFGLTYVFGGGFAFGGRVFSTDKPQSGALALGIDYLFETGTWRPTIGAAYLDDDFYVDFSAGIGSLGSEFNFGLGIGGLGGMQSTAPAAPPPQPPPPPPPYYTD